MERKLGQYQTSIETPYADAVVSRLLAERLISLSTTASKECKQIHSVTSALQLQVLAMKPRPFLILFTKDAIDEQLRDFCYRLRGGELISLISISSVICSTPSATENTGTRSRLTTWS